MWKKIHLKVNFHEFGTKLKSILPPNVRLNQCWKHSYVMFSEPVFIWCSQTINAKCDFFLECNIEHFIELDESKLFYIVVICLICQTFSPYDIRVMACIRDPVKMTHDTTFSQKSQLPSSSGLGLTVFGRYFHKPWLNLPYLP